MRTAQVSLRCRILTHLSTHAGRVPAMFNGCVGVKPTVGRMTTAGVVPACASLDCVSVFAQTVADAAAVVSLAQVQAAPGTLVESAPPRRSDRFL